MNQKVAVGVVFVVAMFMSIMDATIGPVHLVAGHAVANLTAYRVAFLVAAAVAVCAVPCSLSIRDADATATIPRPRGQPDVEPTAEPSAAA